MDNNNNNNNSSSAGVCVLRKESDDELSHYLGCAMHASVRMACKQRAREENVEETPQSTAK